MKLNHKYLVTSGMSESQLMFAQFNPPHPPYDPVIGVLGKQDANSDVYVRVNGSKRNGRRWEVEGIAIPLFIYRDLIGRQANPWEVMTEKYEYFYAADAESGRGTIEFIRAL